MATPLIVPVAGDAARRRPAPEELELVRQFVNTYDVESDWDDLTGPAELSTWLAARRLLAADQRLTDRDMQTAVAFRDVLRAALAANAGHGDGRAARRDLDHFASHYPLRMRINGIAWLEPSRGHGVSPAVARLLGAIYHAMTVGTWARLKVCSNDECQWAYYDHSRNRSGAWCTMAICGNRMKGRAFRTRRAQLSED